MYSFKNYCMSISLHFCFLQTIPVHFLVMVICFSSVRVLSEVRLGHYWDLMHILIFCKEKYHQLMHRSSELDSQLLSKESPELCSLDHSTIDLQLCKGQGCCRFSSKGIKPFSPASAEVVCWRNSSTENNWKALVCCKQVL